MESSSKKTDGGFKKKGEGAGKEGKIVDVSQKECRRSAFEPARSHGGKAWQENRSGGDLKKRGKLDLYPPTFPS